MTNLILTALCALTLGTAAPEAKDTTVFYMIDGKVEKKFDGSQLNGKTIASYRIDYAKDMQGNVTKVHFIKTTDAPKQKEEVQYFVNDQIVSESDFKKVNSADVKQMFVYKAGSDMAISLTGSALVGAVRVVLKDGAVSDPAPALDEVVVVSYGSNKNRPAYYSTEEEAVPFALVDIKPRFQGESSGTFSQWVNMHLLYPDAARAAGVQGRVILSFKVNSDGKVSDVRVLRGVCDALDQEAVRVVSSSPAWTPGEHNGKPVAVVYTFPVVFKIK